MLPILGGQNGNPGCYRAMVFALNGQKIAAIEALSEAISHGSSAKFAAADDDFASVRNLPDVRSVTR
jgi:hypothetical protein